MRSLIDLLERWTDIHPHKRLWTFLDASGREVESYTYAEFTRRTRDLARHLAEGVGLRPGDRALLVYPPGLELVVAFFACVRTGVLPVPLSPPTLAKADAGLAKLDLVARDCQASVALTTGAYRQTLDRTLARSAAEGTPGAGGPSCPWRTTDDVQAGGGIDVARTLGPILFLQYTSGSTGDPKGVVVSHANVIHNATCASHGTIDDAAVGLSWLPQYHDMGLIGYYLSAVVLGGATVGFSPFDFLRRPVLWFETMSRVRATHTAAPNFAFEYCLRMDKVPEAALGGLDLSSLRVLVNGAEPVRPETQRRFFERFAAYGLRAHAQVAAYGLAENTLGVTRDGRQVIRVGRHELVQGRAVVIGPSPDQDAPEDALELASCGTPLAGVRVRIVDPDTRNPLGDGHVGEIWVTGESTCAGYWSRPELSTDVFGNCLAAGRAGDGDGPYLRTGDLGFVRGDELFVCGRLKDVIINRGANYYPHDIEAAVEAASPYARPGSVVAFDAGGSEGVVVLVEIGRTCELPDPRAIARAIRLRVGLEPEQIAFVPPNSILRTSSGKLARARTRDRWCAGELPVVSTYRVDVAPAPGAAPTLHDRIASVLARYRLDGSEAETLADLGVDSLGMVSLVLELEELLEAHGAPELARVVDAPLLRRLTVAELFALVDQFEHASAAGVALLRRTLARAEAGQRRQECAQMRADAVLGPEVEAAPAEAGPVHDVLLTGPTGFLGPFLLRSLLARTPYTYHALTRAESPEHGMRRIRESLQDARLWEPDLEAQLYARVRIVCGDLARPRLGLTVAQWEALAAETQAVVHNAALVNYVLPYAALKPHNVEGTRELLRLAAVGRTKHFHFVSSTIIFGWSSYPVVLESDNNADMEALDFGYSQTKWVAEQLVFGAERQGLPVRIYRPAFVTASRSGVGSSADVVVRLLAFMIKHGLAVRARNQVSLLPVDVTADSIAGIFARETHSVGAVPSGTVHITVDEFHTIEDVTRAITRATGRSFAYHDVPTFVAELRRRATPDDPVYPFIDFFTRSHAKLVAMEDKRYENARYRTARRTLGVHAELPSLEEIVAAMLSHMRNAHLVVV